MEQLKAKPICETCLHTLDGATAADGSKAKVRPGDISICFYCGQISIYTDSFNLRKITPDELNKLMEDSPDEFILLLKAVHNIVKRNKQN